METYYTVHTFVSDKRTNKYSEITSNFLTRQLIIDAQFKILFKTPFLEQLNFFGQWLTFRTKSTRQLVFHKGLFITKLNRKTHAKNFRNFIALSLISQSYENFEALIIAFYRKKMELDIKNEDVRKLVLSKTPRTNREIMQLFKKLFPSTSTVLTDDFFSWFNVIENVRHSSTHTNQLLESSTVRKKGIDIDLLIEHFELKRRKHRKFQLITKLSQGQNIIKTFTDNGFHLFEMISKDEDQRIRFKEERKPHEKPPLLSKAQFIALMQSVRQQQKQIITPKRAILIKRKRINPKA